MPAESGTVTRQGKSRRKQSREEQVEQATVRQRPRAAMRSTRRVCETGPRGGHEWLKEQNQGGRTWSSAIGSEGNYEQKTGSGAARAQVMVDGLGRERRADVEATDRYASHCTGFFVSVNVKLLAIHRAAPTRCGRTTAGRGVAWQGIAWETCAGTVSGDGRLSEVAQPRQE